MITSSRSSRCTGGRMAHAVDLFVDRGSPSQYRCRSAAHRPPAGSSRNRKRNTRPRCSGKKLLHLAIELRRQGLVRRQHQGGPLCHFLDDVGDGEGLARTGDAEQHLGAFTAFVGACRRTQAADQLVNGDRLVTLGFIVTDHLERLAALRLFRRGGRWGTHTSPFISSRPCSMRCDSAETVAVTPLVEAISMASSAETSSPATGFSPAATRARTSLEPPIMVPPPVRLSPTMSAGFDLLRAVLRAGFGDFAGASSCASRSISSAQAEISPESGTPDSGGCGASSKPLPGAFVLSVEDLLMNCLWGELDTN